MRLLIVTDAWRPQVNGVVRSLEYMAEQAPAFGAEVTFLTPQQFRSVPMPSYPEIRLSMAMPGQGLHDELPHALSGISRGAGACAGILVLRISPSLPSRRQGRDGQYAIPGARTDRARFPKHPALDARRGHGAVSSASKAVHGP